MLPRNEAPQKLPQPTHREVTAWDSASVPFQVSGSCQHFAHAAALTWGEGATTKQWVLPALPSGTLPLKRSGHGAFVNLFLKTCSMPSLIAQHPIQYSNKTNNAFSSFFPLFKSFKQRKWSPLLRTGKYSHRETLQTRIVLFFLLISFIPICPDPEATLQSVWQSSPVAGIGLQSSRFI